MSTRIEVNSQTGQQVEIAVDDAWLLSQRSNYLLLSWDGMTNTLSAQLQTPILTSTLRDDVLEVSTWRLQIGDIIETIDTDINGQWSDTIQFANDDPYSVYALPRTEGKSNEITIQDGI